MDNMISSDELGELRCSDLDVPLFTSETFREVVLSYLHDIESEQWMILAVGNIDADTVILLSDLCREIVEIVCSLVLDEVTPQVKSWICGQIFWEDDSSSISIYSSDSMYGIEGPQGERNYCTVTAEDIQASLGNSLHRCLENVLEVEEETSEYSEGLLELVAEEVARKVNRTLTVITRSTTSSPRSEESVESARLESPTKSMVYNVARILAEGLCRKYSPRSSDEVSQESDCSESSMPDEVTIVEELSPELFKDSESQGQWSTDVSSFEGSVSPVSIKELLQEYKTFLAVFLGKLLDHIIIETIKTSVMDLDFDGILKNLMRHVGEPSFSTQLPVGRLHRTIFDNLCLEFGSTKRLQAAIMSKDEAFEKAIARQLKMQLPEATPKKNSFVKKEERPISRRKSHTLSPACEVDTLVSQTEVVLLENGSTPQDQKKEKCNAIIRMFSTLSQIKHILKYTVCGSQDD